MSTGMRKRSVPTQIFNKCWYLIVLWPSNSLHYQGMKISARVYNHVLSIWLDSSVNSQSMKKSAKIRANCRACLPTWMISRNWKSNFRQQRPQLQLTQGELFCSWNMFIYPLCPKVLILPFYQRVSATLSWVQVFCSLKPQLFGRPSIIMVQKGHALTMTLCMTL